MSLIRGRRSRSPRVAAIAGTLALVLGGSALTAVAKADVAIPTNAEAARGPLVFAPKGLTTDRFAAATLPTTEQLEGAGGTTIVARVYRPDTSSDPSWRTPVILDMGPYFESTYWDAHALGPAPQFEDLAQRLVDYFTPKGYAVVKVEMRGTGRSGGCFDSWGPDSAQDFKIAVEHYAHESWSNGRVGSWGGSADGTIQNAGAETRPDGLTTTVVLNPMSSFYDGKAFDGVPYDGIAIGGSDYYPVGMIGTDATDASPQEHADEATTRAVCGLGEDFPQTQDPYVDESEDGYFQDRDWRPDVTNITASTLYYAAFQDAVDLPVAADGWYDQLRGFKRAIFSQLTHEPPFESALTRDNLQYLRSDFWDIFHAWFDQWLLGLDTGVGKWPNVQAQDEHNTWRAVPSFAQLGTNATYPLGKATIEPPTAGQAEPVCGLTPTLGTTAEPNATQPFQEAEQLCWQTRPLDVPTHLAGEPHLVLPITLDKTDARFMFDLEEAKADGTTRYLTRGYLAASRRSCETCPGTQLTATPVPPGEVTYDLRSIPFDVWLAAGSSLRLVLSGVDPTDGPSTGKIGKPQFRGLPEGNGFTATIALSGAKLELPVANETCGLLVASAQPPGPTPDCPNPGVSR